MLTVPYSGVKDFLNSKQTKMTFYADDINTITKVAHTKGRE